MRLSVSLGKGQVRDNDKQLVSSFSVHRAVSCFTVFTAIYFHFRDKETGVHKDRIEHRPWY